MTPIPYVALQQMFDESAPWGMHAYEKAVYLDELTDGAIDVIVEHQAKKMSPLSFVPIFVLGGAYAASPTATRQRSAAAATSATSSTSRGHALTPPTSRPSATWVRAFWAALVPHAVGVGSYVNFMAEYEEDRVRSAYGAKYDRLQQIKAQYDPDNVFHLNANILPA